MTIKIEEHPFIHARLTAKELHDRYGVNTFIRCSNKYIAILCNGINCSRMTHVSIIDKRKNPIHKQHMQLMQGKRPQQYIEDEHMHRVYKLSEEEISNHTYELYVAIR